MQCLTPFTVGDNIVNIIKDIDTPSTLSNEECNPSTNVGTTDAALEPIVDADVGCLCIPNSSSTLGGLCASDNTISAIKKTTRHLQKDLDRQRRLSQILNPSLSQPVYVLQLVIKTYVLVPLLRKKGFLMLR